MSDINMKHDNEIHVCGINCISWRAIFVSAAILVGLSFLFNLLIISVGFTIFTMSEDGKIAFATGSFIALIILTILLMSTGGWIAGYLARSLCYRRQMGEIHGFTAWSLALIITICLTSQAGLFISNYNYIISKNIPVENIVPATLTKTIPATSKQSLSKNTSLNEAEANSLAMTTFSTFVLLGLGALSAAFGGRIGMQFRRKEKIKTI
jgi:hypothetical protein